MKLTPQPIQRYLKTCPDAAIVDHLAARLARMSRADGIEITQLRCRACNDGEAWIFDGATRWAAAPQRRDALRAMIAAALDAAKAGDEATP